MIRICLINWFANRAGGADVYTESLALGLAARGHEITVVCYDASCRVESACRVVRVPRPTHGLWPCLWRIAPALVGPHWARHLGTIRGHAPDVIAFSPAVCCNALAARFLDVPLVYLPHARIAPLEVAGGLPPGMLRLVASRTQYRAERQALLRSAVTVRFTPELAALLVRHYRLPPCVRFEVIPQAVDVPSLEAVPAHRQGPIRILAVGRLIQSKNLELIIESLRTAHEADWHLDVVGDGPDRPTLESAACAAGLATRVTFHGHQDVPSQFYARADLLAFPSRLENVSLVVLEAMTHGVPALVIRADGLNYLNVHHEIIHDQVDGLIASDEAHFGNLLRACIADPGGVRHMGIAARDAAANHTWPAALDRWERLLGELATSRQKRAAW